MSEIPSTLSTVNLIHPRSSYVLCLNLYCMPYFMSYTVSLVIHYLNLMNSFFLIGLTSLLLKIYDHNQVAILIIATRVCAQVAALTGLFPFNVFELY